MLQKLLCLLGIHKTQELRDWSESKGKFVDCLVCMRCGNSKEIK